PATEGTASLSTAPPPPPVPAQTTKPFVKKLVVTIGRRPSAPVAAIPTTASSPNNTPTSLPLASPRSSPSVSPSSPGPASFGPDPLSPLPPPHLHRSSLSNSMPSLPRPPDGFMDIAPSETPLLTGQEPSTTSSFPASDAGIVMHPSSMFPN